MHTQRAIPAAMFVIGLYLAITSLTPERATADFHSRPYPTRALPFTAPALAAEQHDPKSNIPLESAIPPSIALITPTAEPPALAEPVQLAQAPATMQLAEQQPEQPQAAPDFYPDLAIEQAAIEAGRDLPVIQCPCGVLEERPFVPMTEQQQQQSRQRTR